MDTTPLPELVTNRWWMRDTPTSRFTTFQAILDHFDLDADDVLVDLGCGYGVAMVTAVDRIPGLRVVGLDLVHRTLKVAGSWLEEHSGRYGLVQADLGRPLPLATASANALVCHDVMELLRDPMAVVVEAARVMRPGSRSVWSGTDFESLVINGADRHLTRRVVQAHADYTPPGAMVMNFQGQMGRKLPGLIARSPLEVVSIDAHALQRSQLAGPAKVRIEAIVKDLTIAAQAGEVDLRTEELAEWMASLVAADEAGDFFYCQTVFMVTARRPSA